MEDDPIAEAAERGKRRVIGLKKTSDGATGRGVVTNISEANDGAVRVSIRHGAKPKKDKDGCSVGPWPDESTCIVPAAVARGITLGDKVRITFVKE